MKLRMASQLLHVTSVAWQVACASTVAKQAPRGRCFCIQMQSFWWPCRPQTQVLK